MHNLSSTHLDWQIKLDDLKESLAIFSGLVTAFKQYQAPPKGAASLSMERCAHNLQKAIDEVKASACGGSIPLPLREAAFRIRSASLRSQGLFTEFLADLRTTDKSFLVPSKQAEFVIDLLGDVTTELLRQCLSSPARSNDVLAQLVALLEEARTSFTEDLEEVTCQVADVLAIVDADKRPIADIRATLEKLDRPEGKKGLLKIVNALGRHWVTNARSFLAASSQDHALSDRLQTCRDLHVMLKADVANAGVGKPGFLKHCKQAMSLLANLARNGSRHFKELHSNFIAELISTTLEGVASLESELATQMRKYINARIGPDTNEVSEMIDSVQAEADGDFPRAVVAELQSCIQDSMLSLSEACSEKFMSADHSTRVEAKIASQRAMVAHAEAWNLFFTKAIAAKDASDLTPDDVADVVVAGELCEQHVQRFVDTVLQPSVEGAIQDRIREVEECFAKTLLPSQVQFVGDGPSDSIGDSNRAIQIVSDSKSQHICLASHARPLKGSADKLRFKKRRFDV